MLFAALLILLLLTSPAAARSYSFDKVDTDIVVDESGIAHVTQRIHYSFSTYPGDEFNEVLYVAFSGQNGITMHNATGYLEGYPNASFNVSPYYNESGFVGYEMTCQLPHPNPESVIFVVSYDYYGIVNAYNDVTEFNYMLWSNQWNRSIPILNATITIQNVSTDEDLVHFAFVHPLNHVTSTSLDSESIDESQVKTLIVNIQAADIPAYTWLDTRIIYPSMLFPNPQYVNVINNNGLQDIMDEERAYERADFYLLVMMLVQLLIILIGIVISFFIYFKYGREYKTDYNGLYERELPTDTKPALINAIIKGHGKPDMNAFVSTIMSLVDRDYLSISEIEKMSSRGKASKEIILKFENQPDSKLEKIESDIYSFLKGYAINNEIVWKDFQKKLGSNDKFYNFLNKWYASVSKAANFSSYFEHKGNSLISGTGIGLIVISIFMYFFSEIVAPLYLHPTTATVGSLCFLGGIVGAGLIVYPLIFKKSMGRWTKDGRVFSLKWQNFEKYLTDYSLIEKYPPASVIIWDHYIVYAMALGVAETALKNMKLSSPAGQIEGSHFHYIYYYPFFYSGMHSSYSSSVPQSGGGGLGGIGGGFGGGGIGGGGGGGFGGAR
jgi:Predicted membrane protein